MTRDDYLAARTRFRVALEAAGRHPTAQTERELAAAETAWERAELAWLAQEAVAAPTLLWT